MKMTKNSRGNGPVAPYEDRGFLGDYARDLPSNVAEPLGKAIYAIGRQAYLSQTARDALAFQHALVKQVNDIYEKNRDDPAGYAHDFDAVVTEVSGNGRSQLAERTKREHMVSIAQNVEAENYQASQRIIRDLMAQTMDGMAVPIHLLSSEDGAVRNMGREGLERILSRTVDAVATVDGNDNPLISPQEVDAFLQRFNGNIRIGSVANRLASCRTVDDVDNLVTAMETGKLLVPQYRIGPHSGMVREADDRPLDINNSTGEEGEHMRSLVEKRKFEIARDGVTVRQLALLRDTTEHGPLLGTTQPTADTWFQEYGGTIGDAISRGEDPKTIIGYLAKRMDRVPSQVVATIRGAVASGDNAAIQVAAPYVTAWHNENPAAMARAFQDDGVTLTRMFALANQLSTASTTQTGVRDRTLKTFSSQARGGEDQEAAQDRLLADHVDDSMLADLVALWKNNRAIRKDFTAHGEPSDDEQLYLSPFFLGTLRDQLRGYLDDSGGDLPAATRMMEGSLSQLGISRLGTVPSPLMAHCPENFQGVAANRKSLANSLESIGKKWYNGAVANGEIPDGAEYGGTFLLSDDITDSMAEGLDFNASRGIDHIISEDGKMIRCPSYVQMVNFSFGGLVHAMPMGRFFPSLPNGQETEKTEGGL
jgi:hypothetical protein